MATAAGGGTNVWVRHSLLIAALSQSSATGGGANKSRLPPNNSTSTNATAAVITGLPSAAAGGNKLSKSRDEDLASDFTSLTANSSIASGVNSTVGSTVGVGGSTKHMWGWVKAKARADASVDSDSAPDGVMVTIIDADHPDLDGRHIHIPSKLLQEQQQADGKKNISSGSSSSSQIYGPDLVMANAWASFGSSSASVGQSSSRDGRRRSSGGQQQLSGAAMEVPPADLIQVSYEYQRGINKSMHLRAWMDGWKCPSILLDSNEWMFLIASYSISHHTPPLFFSTPTIVFHAIPI